MRLQFVFCLVFFAQLVAPSSYDTSPLPCVAPPYVIDVYNVTSTVSRRFACTRVYSEIVNTANSSQEMCFSVQLPKEAFMSGLCLEVGGRKYSGVVREKEAARQTHEQNVRTGVTSGLVESRGMDKFRVCLSAGPGMRAAFSVEYQQLLIMRLGIVKHTVSIQPTQPVPHLLATVSLLDDLLPETLLHNRGDLALGPEISVCTFEPSLVEQIAEDCELGVLVDLETSYRPRPVAEGVGEGSESGGYFVQFFSPSAGLQCICQRFIFVIDKSGSMWGQKMRQAKQAALYLLRSLNETDYFNIIAFDSFARSFQAGPVSVGEHRERGIRFVEALQASGGTNINEAALTAVNQLCGAGTRCVSQVTLLSDGQATSGVTNLLTIASNIRRACPGSAVSLNCLSFGRQADHSLMQALAYGNGGRAQRIYSGQDAETQLVDFLRTVLCPLLSNIRFLFPDGSVRNLSVTSFPTYYRGDELLVSGEREGTGPLSFQVLAASSGGLYSYRGQIETRLSGGEERTCLEGQLHAYQLIRQGIEALSAAPSSDLATEMRERILSYALQFRFVTPLTSLLVSPREAPECDCPSSCSCGPRACAPPGTAPEDSKGDNIKLNPSTESATQPDRDSNTRNYFRGGPPAAPLPAYAGTAFSLAAITTRTAIYNPTTTTTTPDPTTTTHDPTTTTIITPDPTTTTTPPDPTTTTTTTLTTPDPTTTTTTTTPDPTTTTTLTTHDPTTTTIITPDPTTTTTPPDPTTTTVCGEWKNLTSCAVGTARYIQVRCGTCDGSKTVQRARCGTGYRGKCYLKFFRDGTPSCVPRKSVLSKNLSRRLMFNRRFCDKMSIPAPPPGARCKYMNGSCRLLS